MKKIIVSSAAPKAVGPYSQAVLFTAKYVMEISGQIGVNPSSGKLVEGINAQTEQIFENLKAILSEAGFTLKNVVKVRVFLADIKDYSQVNQIYSKYFTEEYPARVALAVKDLPIGALIEIECTAIGDKIKE